MGTLLDKQINCMALVYDHGLAIPTAMCGWGNWWLPLSKSPFKEPVTSGNTTYTVAIAVFKIAELQQDWEPNFGKGLVENDTTWEDPSEGTDDINQLGPPTFPSGMYSVLLHKRSHKSDSVTPVLYFGACKRGILANKEVTNFHEFNEALKELEGNCIPPNHVNRAGQPTIRF